MFKTTKHSKILPIVIMALTLLVALTLLGACQTATKDYDYLVTFDYNVGDKYKSDNKLTDRDVQLFLGVGDNSLVGLKPGDRNDFASMSFSGYYCDNKWYLPQLDAEGNIVKDENGIVALGEEWNFETMRVTADVTLYANLVQKVEMKFVDSQTGDVVKTISDGEPGKTRNKPSSRQQPSKDNSTLYEYYADAECTQVFSWPYTFGKDDVTVYVKFIPGRWTIVKTTREFTSALLTGGNIYVDADLDFTGVEWSIVEQLNVTINGNGHTISNVSIDYTFNRNNPANCALFATLGEKANVYDLTFSNVSINAEVTLSGDYKLAMFACGAVEGARVSGVSVSGTINCNHKSYLEPAFDKWIIDNNAQTTAPAPVDIESAVTIVMTGPENA